MSQIFADSFESGDTSAWDATAGTPTVTLAAAMIFTWGLEINAAGEYVQDDFTRTTQLWLRFYFDPNTFAMSGDTIRIIIVWDGATQVGQIQMRDNGADYEVRIRVYDDLAAWNSSSWYTIQDDANCIGANWNFVNNVGSISLYLEDALQETVPNIDLGTRGADEVDMGWRTSSGSPTGTLYFDHYESDDASKVDCVAASPVVISTNVVSCPRTRYEIYLTTDEGTRLADSDGRSPLASFLWLRASRVVNGIGWIDIAVPLSFNRQLFLKRDLMIQIWRQPRGGELSSWRPYFLRKWRHETSEGHKALVLSGPCVNHLLWRRIVAAYSGSSEASKTDFADDMMKEAVTESMSDAASPTPDAGTRAWGNLSVAADVGAGPSISCDFAWLKLLTMSGGGALPKIARASRVAGTDLYFDIVPSTVTAAELQLEFRTNVGQPGQDLSSFVLFDESRGNMGNAFYEYDSTKEENYIYGGGQGQGADRNIQQVYDADRYNQSIWNRCEGDADARNAESDNAVREAARNACREGEPVERFGATAKDTDETRFGIHWNWGDRVKARYEGKEFKCVINSVVLSVNRAGEQIAARLDYVSDV